MLGKFSVKKPYTVIVGVILIIVLGVISFMNMTTDLLPSMNFPYVIVYTTYIGATPEQIEDEVTRPMESAFATLTDVKNITSQSSDNLSLLVLEFNETADMNTAMIEINSEITTLSAGWSDSVSAPAIMKINPDMLPVSIVSVAREGMDIYELSEYVEETLVQEYEAINGVASVSASGLIHQEVDVTIEQDRIDVLNNAILRDVDEELAKVEQQLDDAQAQISDGKAELARQKRAVMAQLNDAMDQLEDGEAQMAAGIEELKTQRAALQEQLDQVNAGIEQMEPFVNMTDEERAMLLALEEQLGNLKGQKEQIQAELDRLENGEGNAALSEERASAVARRDSLIAERDTLNAYIEDLKNADEESLNSDIASLNSRLEEANAELAAAQAVLDEKTAARNATQQRINELSDAIAALGGTPAVTAAPTENVTAAPTENVTAAPTGEATAAPTGEATAAPTGEATAAPTGEATAAPTDEATAAPTNEATAAPTGEATTAPTDEAAAEPTSVPTEGATEAPAAPTATPSPADALIDLLPEEYQSAAEGILGALEDMFTASAAGESLETLQAQLADAQKQLAMEDAAVDEAQAEVDRVNAEISSLQSQLDSKNEALEDVQSGDLSTRIEAAEREKSRLDSRIGVLDAEIEAIDQLLSGDSSLIGTLRAALENLDETIEKIENSEEYQALKLLSDKDELNKQYAAAVEGKAQLEAGIATMDEMLEKLESGVIPGGMIEGIDEDTSLEDAKDMLADARRQAVNGFAEAEQMLEDASAELAEGRKEFEEQRDEALKNAGLDGVITIEVVAGLLGAQNISMPAGYVYDLDEEQYMVRVGNKFTAMDELKNLKLFSLGMESVDEVRLSDVARVEITDNADETFTKVNGIDGIMLSIEKQSTFSTTEVAQSVAEKSEELLGEVDGLTIVDLFNQGDYIDLIVDSVIDNLVSGGGLAILVLLLFLLDWRPTAIVAISIPLSVVAAFVCMYFSGITLNILSLSGLALGVGMLVDNSIVAIENIYRLRNEENMPILHACILGVKQVGGSLFSSTLTTICVFLPIVFVEGMARDLFADMGLTIAFSLLASLLAAMTVVPAASAALLKRQKKSTRKGLFFYIQNGYAKMIRGALKVRWLVLLAAVALLVVSVMQVPDMGISFMPEVNSDQMTASLPIDPEQELAPQQERALDMMNRMLEVPGIEHVGLSTGGGMMSMMSGGGGASMSYYIIVDTTAGRENADIAADIRAAAEELNLDLSISTSTMDISMLTGSGISINITGKETDALQQTAREVAEIVSGIDGAVEINDGLEDAVPEIRIIVDKELAADNNLTVGQVLQFVATKLVGKTEITQATLDGKNLSVYMIDGRNSSITPDTLEDLEMEVTSGDKAEMVRIGDIADVVEAESFGTINRANQQRMLTVSFRIADGYSANHVSAALEEKLDGYTPPDGCAVSLSGENETVMAIMEDMVFMVLVAILMIFLIMVAQFQSFKSPFIVLFTIPLAFTGGLLALQLTGMDLSIVAMIGFLMLAGVIVNNGIVFVDTVNQLRIGGMRKKDALAETGRLRLRPILMTTLTTILGMSTMALAQGMGAEMMQPMAVVTIGGLSYATLMTLFVVPCMYDIFNGEKMNAREIQMAKEAAGMARGDEMIDGETAAPAAEKPAEVPAAPAAEKPAVPAEVPAAPAEEPAAPAEPKVPEVPVWTAPVKPAAPVQPTVHPAQGYPYGYPPYGYPAPRRTSPSRRAANRDRVRRRRDER